MGRVCLPPDITELKGGVIFLAGPIQGAADWQHEAVKILRSLDPNFHIANPRRKYLDGEFVYRQQVDWETYYLNRAAKNGVILFWLAKEYEHLPSRAYAQTSRLEFGEWKAKHEWGLAKLAVGIEEGFSGRRYIGHRMAQDCPDIPVNGSLEETCAEAVRIYYAQAGEF